MQTMTTTEFQAQCPDILEHIPADGLTIMSEGNPVAEIHPKKPAQSRIDNSDLVGSMRKSENQGEDTDNTKWIGSIPDIVISGDIFSTGIKWDAES